MKHIKIFNESHQDKLKQKAEFLIDAFQTSWRNLPNTVGRYQFTYSYDIRDAKPGVVVSQYGDFFFIMPSRISKLELPLLEVLLNGPFNGSLYQSNHDHQLQVRISGFDVERMMNV